MIFDDLSNTPYHALLRDPGAEIDGGRVFKHPWSVAVGAEHRPGAGYHFIYLQARTNIHRAHL